MKAARGLQSAGRVTEAAYEPPVLRGLVREGNTQYRAGLRIGSKTDIENLCGCRESRQRGLICSHSLAVGLEVLRPAQVNAQTQPSQPAATQASTPVNQDGTFKASCGTTFGDLVATQFSSNFSWRQISRRPGREAP
jgi:hypothetical protein